MHQAFSFALKGPLPLPQEKQMAHFIHYSLLLLPLLFACGTISAHNHHHHHHHLKSLHFTLYQQETVNKTLFLIVNGVVGAKTPQTTTPFGTIDALRDPLTTTVDPSSRIVGFAEGVSITTSFDGLWSLTVGKLTLSMKRHKGTISLLGGIHGTRMDDIPVVGGTGDFLFVQGYARASPVYLAGLRIIYKLEFHLYWPPYASQATH